MSLRSLGTKPPCRLNRCTLTALTLIVDYATDKLEHSDRKMVGKSVLKERKTREAR